MTLGKHGGSCRCDDIEGGRKSLEAKYMFRCLSIAGLPYVRPMSTVSAVAGKQFHIKCPVAGYPIESIVWEKGEY